MDPQRLLESAPAGVKEVINLSAPSVIPGNDKYSVLANVLYLACSKTYCSSYYTLVTEAGLQTTANWGLVSAALILARVQRSEARKLLRDMDEAVNESTEGLHFDDADRIYRRMRESLQLYLRAAGLLLFVWPLTNVAFWSLPGNLVFILYGSHLLLFLHTLWVYYSFYAEDPSEEVIVAFERAMSDIRKRETGPDERV